MASYDRVLVQPTRAELERARVEAAGAANRRCRQRTVSWMPGMSAVWTEADATPEGWRQWHGGAAPGQKTSVVVLAWWTDALGRKHYRIVGGRGTFAAEALSPGNILSPPDNPRPPLHLVYPEPTFLVTRGGRRRSVALCDCGAFGEPADLAWMGPCCGPCHDRGEDGTAAARALEHAGAVLPASDDPVTALAFAPDGRTLAWVTGGDFIHLWDVETAQERTARSSPLAGVAFAPDGRTLAAATGGFINLWETEPLRVRTRFWTGAVTYRLTYCPDGQTLAGIRDSRPVLWEVATGRVRRTFGGVHEASWCVDVAPDGRTLAAGNSLGQVRIWDVAGGNQVALLPRPGMAVHCLAYAPDGATLAVGHGPSPHGGPPPSRPEAVVVWDVARRQLRASMIAHRGYVQAVAFGLDGKLLATGGIDTAVGVWDADGRELAGVEWHRDIVRCVAFAPDGRLLATGSHDGTVRLWPVELLRGT